MTAAQAAASVLRMKPKTKVTERPKQRKGFAAMSKAMQAKICAMGGRAVMSKPGHAAKIGRLGGLNSHGNTNSRKARTEA